MKGKLSVIIPVLNVEDILADCLETINWADEIICIDMNSRDATRKVCKKYNVKVLKNIPKGGNFDLNRQLGMEIAKNEWILKIDSDDRLTKKLQLEIKKIVKSKEKTADGYKLYNKLFFFNKEIKHGIKTPKSHELRLFKKNKFIYKPIKFHQLIHVKDKTDYLKGEYLHFNSQSIYHFIKKTNIYTNLDSKKDYKFRKNVDFKHTIFSPFLTFIRLFLFRKGFLDGTYGLIVNTLYSIYNYIYKIKIWEKRKIMRKKATKNEWF